MLATAAACSVHAVQIGFVERCSVPASVIRIEGAIEEYFNDVRKQAAVFVFDIRAASPSLSREWLCLALCALRLSAWLIVGVRSSVRLPPPRRH